MSGDTENLTRLATRFVDDRDSLDDLELETLIEGLRAHPQVVETLRRQLTIDELLAQRLSLDRRDFALQVDQRIADEREGEELERQASEIRELAMRQLQQPRPRGGWSEIAPYAALAAMLLMAVGAGTFWWSRGTIDHGPLCQVDDVREQPEIFRATGGTEPATAGATLFAGDRLSTRGGAYVRVRYLDGTTATLEPESALAIAAPTAAYGKWLDLLDGTLHASVAPQPAGRPLAVSTRDAHAVVRGTRFTVRSTRVGTELEVAEGKVELVERREKTSRMVAAREAARATFGQAPTPAPMRWPAVRDHLTFAMTDGHHAMSWPNEDELPEWLEFEAGGEGADWTAANQMILDGGWFRQRAVGEVFSRRATEADAFTIEFTIVPTAPETDGVVLAFGDAFRTNATIRQSGGKLALVMDVLDGDKDRPTSRVETFDVGDSLVAGSPVHLVVACDAARIRAWQDGRTTLDRELAGASGLALPRRGEWSESPLTFGADWFGQFPWSGRVERLALHARAFDAEDANGTFAALETER